MSGETYEQLVLLGTQVAFSVRPGHLPVQEFLAIETGEIGDVDEDVLKRQVYRGVVLKRTPRQTLREGVRFASWHPALQAPSSPEIAE